MDLKKSFMISKLWIKNGVFASDTIELNGCVVCNPTEDMLRQAGYEEYQEPVPTEEEKLEQAKVNKIAEIEQYDNSPSVNSFTLNGKERWLKNDLRRSLSYSTNILKEDGEKTVDIWFDTDCETMNIDNALYMLKELEVYAKQTNNVTHQHKAEVMALTSIEEVDAYDITKDYPEKLVFSNEKLSEEVSNLK